MLTLKPIFVNASKIIHYSNKTRTISNMFYNQMRNNFYPYRIVTETLVTPIGSDGKPLKI